MTEPTNYLVQLIHADKDKLRVMYEDILKFVAYGGCASACAAAAQRLAEIESLAPGAFIALDAHEHQTIRGQS